MSRKNFLQLGMEEPVLTNKIRLLIDEALAVPEITNFAVYLVPEKGGQKVAGQNPKMMG